MPAIMDDPFSPTIYRVSGAPPYPEPGRPELPPGIIPRQVTLRDRQTIATVVPFVSSDQVPHSLLLYLSDQFAKEIEGGDTYPMIKPMPLERFAAYWFQNFAGIMLLGQIDHPEDLVEGKDWSKECLGSFYIKPNYPGRSSHVCNAGFLVTDASRNRGVGRLMGESYLDWAPKLGYTYSVFNLVYETNVASCKIWDALGFKRIGRVKGCGNLKSYPDRLIDAIIYGRELGTGAGEGGDPLLVSEERFDKIRFYLKYGRYPNGSDRAEKSRLRSAATHYKLLDNDVLMLKDKEVISDPAQQMDIARRVHRHGAHAGINKTTATIAEKYHWSRIKETVSDVIKTCDQCKELGKAPSVQNTNASRRLNVNDSDVSSPMSSSISPGIAPGSGNVDTASSRIFSLQAPAHNEMPHDSLPPLVRSANPYTHPSDLSSLLNPPIPSSHNPTLPHHHALMQTQLHHDSAATLASLHEAADIYHPIDPQIISQPSHHHHHHHRHHHHHPAFDPFPLHHHAQDTVPHHSSPHSSHASLPGHEPYGAHASLSGHEPFQTTTHHPDSFQALLHDPDADGVDGHVQHGAGTQQQQHSHHHLDPPDTDQDQDAVDRDLDMLIEDGC